MKTFALSIATPEGSLYDGQCVQVIVPGSEGVFGVLAGHMDMVAQVKPGIVYIYSKEVAKDDTAGDSSIEKIAISDGIADVSGTQCVLLVEHGQKLSEVNVAELRDKLALVKHQLLKVDTEALLNSLTTEKAFLEAVLENFSTVA